MKKIINLNNLKDELKRDELIEKIKTYLGNEKLKYLLKNIESFETQSLRDLEMILEDSKK